MALISCPECKASVSDQAGSCPHCGYPFMAAQPKPLHPDFVSPKSSTAMEGGKSHPVLWILGLIIGLFVVGMFAAGVQSNTPEGRAKARARDAIALCRKEQSDDLEERSTRRFVRDVCDKMESDFRAKYGVSP